MTCKACECAPEFKIKKEQEVNSSLIELELSLLEEAASKLTESINGSFYTVEKRRRMTEDLVTEEELKVKEYLKDTYTSILKHKSGEIKSNILYILTRINNVCDMYAKWELKELK